MNDPLRAVAALGCRPGRLNAFLDRFTAFLFRGPSSTQ